MYNLWYKNAVIYCVDLDAFMDSDGDGVGDFQGLADQLDHIEALGCNCIWLLPFYPTLDRDNGYVWNLTGRESDREPRSLQSVAGLDPSVTSPLTCNISLALSARHDSNKNETRIMDV